MQFDVVKEWGAFVAVSLAVLGAVYSHGRFLAGLSSGVSHLGQSVAVLQTERVATALKQAELDQRLSRVETKLEVVWASYLDEIGRRDESVSAPLRLNPQGVAIARYLKDLVKDVPFSPDRPVSDLVLFEIPDRVGITQLRKASQDLGVPLGDVLSVCNVIAEYGVSAWERITREERVS